MLHPQRDPKPCTIPDVPWPSRNPQGPIPDSSLSRQDLNLDKQIQNLLCCQLHYGRPFSWRRVHRSQTFQSMGYQPIRDPSFQTISFLHSPVGIRGFEPLISCSQSRRFSQAKLHPGDGFCFTREPVLKLLLPRSPVRSGGSF